MSRPAPDRVFLLAHPAHFIALGFGVGLLSARAAGTLGTLLALPLYALLPASASAGYWLWLAVFLAVGVWACHLTGEHLGEHDHGSIVWDEVTAFLAVLPFAPQTGWGLILAFLLFRLFDIWKPFPIGWMDQNLKSGLGGMLDDLLAAGYSIVCLLALQAWL